MTSVWYLSVKKKSLVFKKYPIPKSKKSVRKKVKKR